MTFNENKNMLPGQVVSKNAEQRLEEEIKELKQTVGNLASIITGMVGEIQTGTIEATAGNITDVVSDTVDTNSLTAQSAVIDNQITAGSAVMDSAEISDINADAITSGTIQSNSATIGTVNSTDVNTQNVDTVNGTVTGTMTVNQIDVSDADIDTASIGELETGPVTHRGDEYFPEENKIYGEYLDIEARKAQIKSLITEPATSTNNLVGFNADGKLIPVDASTDPSNLWQASSVTSIKPKDNKTVEAVKVDARTVEADTVTATETETETITVTDSAEIDGTLTVKGDIIQEGSAYETHVEQLFTKKDIIKTRDGAVSGLTTGAYTGFQAEKYDGVNDGQLVFDKTGEARVGDVGDTQPLLTRTEKNQLSEGNILTWDDNNLRATGSQLCNITQNMTNRAITPENNLGLSELPLANWEESAPDGTPVRSDKKLTLNNLFNWIKGKLNIQQTVNTSENPVSSAAVATALQNYDTSSEVDSKISDSIVDSVTTGNMNAVTSNAVSKELTGNYYNKQSIDQLAEYWTLFYGYVDSVRKTYTLNDGRKFSDYSKLIFCICSDVGNIRNSIFIPLDIFKNTNVYLYGHGSGQTVEADFYYKTDTTVDILQDVNTGAPFTAYVRIIGLK